jgi:hypothetical protein
MSIATKYICKRCRAVKYQLKPEPRVYCHKCQKAVDNLSAKLSANLRAAPHVWSEYSKDNILQDLNWFVRRCNDLGASGPVTSICPGHPMFEQVAAQCTNIREISR